MVLSNLPKGNKIIASLELERKSGERQHYLILVERKNSASPYVFARYEANSEEWKSGFYMSDRAKAIKYFADRCIE